jgi:hypothetical protein
VSRGPAKACDGEWRSEPSGSAPASYSASARGGKRGKGRSGELLYRAAKIRGGEDDEERRQSDGTAAATPSSSNGDGAS